MKAIWGLFTIYLGTNQGSDIGQPRLAMDSMALAGPGGHCWPWAACAGFVRLGPVMPVFDPGHARPLTWARLGPCPGPGPGFNQAVTRALTTYLTQAVTSDLT